VEIDENGHQGVTDVVGHLVLGRGAVRDGRQERHLARKVVVVVVIVLKKRGSMLSSHFSAIFGKKIAVFLRNQCYDQLFA
jgi:hypothetical protein